MSRTPCGKPGDLQTGKDDWKQVHFIQLPCLVEGLKVANIPCANFLPQSRSALALMPQYKLKVFFRLRYMIIIGLPIICFRKQQRQRGKVDQVGENMKIHFGNNSFNKRIILNLLLQLLVSGKKESL